MTWLDKVKERWKRDELEGTWNNNILFERFVQAREDRSKLLRLVEAYETERRVVGVFTRVTGLDNRLAIEAARKNLTALLESDDV